MTNTNEEKIKRYLEISDPNHNPTPEEEKEFQEIEKEADENEVLNKALTKAVQAADGKP